MTIAKVQRTVRVDIDCTMSVDQGTRIACLLPEGIAMSLGTGTELEKDQVTTNMEFTISIHFVTKRINEQPFADGANVSPKRTIAF